MPMSALEKLQTWLSSYPGWEACPAKICLLPKETKEISRREDVLGNTRVGLRSYVNLFWEMERQGSEAENACLLSDFQNWVRQQNALRLAPVFGDIPGYERVWTEKGGLTAGTQIVTYTIMLVAEFMKVYEAS